MTAISVAAVITLTPGIVISLRTSASFDDALGDLPVQPRQLAVQEVQLAQRAVEGQLLIVDEPYV